MSTGRVAQCVAEVSPQQAWDTLANDESSVLIDVRSRAEWSFIGVPDLTALGQSTLLVEWASFPEMSVNPHFAEQVVEALGPDIPAKLLFICRSGARSLSAAKAVAEVLSKDGIEADCINVAEGFEGDLDAYGHRGCVNGWKVRGLAWRQS